MIVQKEVIDKHGSDICFCGDYRSQHDDKGCNICKNLNRNPHDGCTRFRFSHVSKDRTHWNKFFGALENIKVETK